MKIAIKFLSLVLISISSDIFCSQYAPEFQAGTCEQPAYKDYELFKAVMKIREITDKTVDEFRACDFQVDKGSREWPDANPYWDRTEQGLYVWSRICPGMLATPWGQVKLTDCSNGKSYLGFLALGQVLLKRLHAKFEQAFPSRGSRLYEIKPGVNFLQESIKLDVQKDTFELPSLIKNYFDVISQEALRAKKGQEIFVINSHIDNEVQYRITELDDQMLPELHYKQARDYGLEKEIERAWHEHKERYRQEQAAREYALVGF